jgi:hypothetical protein
MDVRHIQLGYAIASEIANSQATKTIRGVQRDLDRDDDQHYSDDDLSNKEVITRAVLDFK